MMKRFLAFFARHHYRFIHTVKIPIVRNAYGRSEKGEFYYHLYESQKGKRKVEFGSTFKMDHPEINGLHFSDYHERILPWLNHRYVPGIPSYKDVDMIDVEVRLSE